MSSRQHILEAVSRNQPDLLPVPEVPDFRNKPVDLVKLFVETAQTTGSSVMQYADFENWIREHFPEGKLVASTVPQWKGNLNWESTKHPLDLALVDLAIIPGVVAAAENGAIWVRDTDCRFRVLPFIAQHLMIFLKKENIVENMHRAYQQITVDETGFGVFIAGPSKTADIEQSLVIGAQGARSLTVVLMD